MKIRFDNMLVLLQPATETSSFGSETTVYAETRTVYAERVKQSGGRSEEVGEHFPDYRAEFVIRLEHPVGENWRARQLTNEKYLYDIVSIIPYRQKGYQTLICVRVNE